MIRTFIIRLTYFVLPVLVFACISDFILSSTLKASKTFASGEYSVWNDLYEGRVSNDIVIYGSSRAVVQIDPRIIEDSLKRSCYNLGIDGHNFWLQYFRHKEFLSYNKVPNLIIHSLDVTTLTDRGELFNSDQFLPYMLFDKTIQSNTQDYDFFSGWDFNVPMVRFMGKQRAMLHAARLLFKEQPDAVGRINGYQAQPKTWNADFEIARKKLSTYNIEVDSSALSLFKRYLRECNDQQIRIIFVYTPQYIEGQQFIQNKEYILNIYRWLGKEYNIPFLDYSADPICQSKDYFYNSGHLNKNGSALFTSKLSHDLKEYIHN
ncbi:MAG TPA: hypothetical protein VK589_19100 [Chryseolinea sp.]|nr:hypothetical protein [Chryseolinea sp.]